MQREQFLLYDHIFLSLYFLGDIIPFFEGFFSDTVLHIERVFILLTFYDTFTFKKKLVIEICKKILDKGLKIVWVAISRVNYVNDEVLYWMRKAGCIQISYGVESGSEKIRKILNKNIKTDQIKKAFALTTKYGIMARAYFIYGCPGESWDTIKETIDLIHEIKPLSIIFYILDIFPGTALYSDFKERCKITDDIWLKRIEDVIYFQSDPDLTQDMILAFGQKLRMDYYENLSGFWQPFRQLRLRPSPRIRCWCQPAR